MALLLLTVVLVPAVLAVAVRISGPVSGPLAAGSAVLSLAPTAALLTATAMGSAGEAHIVWLPAGELEVGLRLDGLSAVMSALVATAGVAALVHASGYFARRARASQAQASLLAFLAAMQGLVLADNFLTLLIFWELVGALSARLIAYERDDPRAAPGAIRAFLTTRSADAGLYIAIAALHAGAGTVAFEATRPEGALGLAVGLGLVIAAAGKSAQVPFQTWLSGAMAGPTPVSALLHSATMVAAGVYLLVRAQDLLAGWPLELAAWIGGLTAVAAAAFALAQRDLKLVLASSTTSQLGLMFLAAGAGAPGVAIFALICHAAGKAGAFLAAGALQRRAGSTSLEALAGIGRQDRPVFWGFAISAASIAAVPPLAAFWSKDTILVSLEHDPALLVLALVASVGTVAYLLRPALILWRSERAPKPAPAGRGWMLAAIGLLTLGTASLGFAAAPLSDILDAEIPAVGALSVALSLATLAAGLGLILADLRPAAPLQAAARSQLGTNRALRALVERPIVGLSALVARADAAIDRVVDAIGRATLGLARGNDRLERHGVDAAVDGVAHAIERAGDELPRLQTGQLYLYLRNTLLGMALVGAVFAIAALA